MKIRLKFFSLDQWFISLLQWIFAIMVVFLWMCETMNLIKHLSKLDFITKYIWISFENQLLKKFENLFKIQYIIVSFTTIRLLLQNFLINNNETELLILNANPGYYTGKHNTRILVNITYISYLFCYLLLISYYRFDSF